MLVACARAAQSANTSGPTDVVALAVTGSAVGSDDAFAQGPFRAGAVVRPRPEHVAEWWREL